MNCYLQMLTILLEGVIVPRAAVRCMFPNERTARDNILRGIREKHIKEIRFETKHGKHERTVNALILTPDGLSYLYQNFFFFFHDTDKSLSPYLDETTPFGSEGMNTRIKRTLAEYAYAAVITMAAGATAHFPLTDRHEDYLHFLKPEITELADSGEAEDDDVFFDEESVTEADDETERSETGRHSYRELLRVIASSRDKSGGRRETGQNLNDYPYTPESPEYMEYIPRPALKHAIQFIYRHDGLPYESRDYDRCRNKGILQSHVRSVLLFTNLECGFRWIRKFTEVDMAVYRSWRRALREHGSREAARNGECGAVFVDNPRHFSLLYNDAPGVRVPRYSKSGAPRKDWFGIGDPFDHFYAVPTNLHGVAMLRRIMLNGDAKLQRDISVVLSAMGFTPSSFGANGIFPFVRVLDSEAQITVQYAICTDLDIITIRKVEDYVAKRRILRGVICEEWQVPYLEAAFMKCRDYIDIFPIPEM